MISFNDLQTIETISIIVASWAAIGGIIYGLNTWRREYIGRRKLQLAEEVLTLFYEARDAIHDIRNEYTYAGEAADRIPPDNEAPKQKEIEDDRYIFFKRYYQRRHLFGKIDAMRYRHMAQFGKDSAKPFDDLIAIVKDMFISAESASDYRKRQASDESKNDDERQRHLDQIRQHQAVVRRSPDNDPITPRLQSVISRIEAQYSTIVGKPK